MTDVSELMRAILAMDSYNRGANAHIYTVGDKLGTFDFKGTSNEQKDSLDMQAGFAASRYLGDDGTIVISYRGTDNTSLGRDGVNTKAGSDIMHGWTIGAGAFASSQAQRAISYYQDVTHSLITDAAPENVLLVGHSLGGGLAGFISQLTGAKATGVDYMPFGIAAWLQAAYEAYQVTGTPPQSAADISAAGIPLPSTGNFTAIHTAGEILESVRDGTIQSLLGAFLEGTVTGTPFPQFFGKLLGADGALTQKLGAGIPDGSLSTYGFGTILDKPNALHSAALAVLLDYAQINDRTLWQNIAPTFLREFFDDRIATGLGLTSGRTADGTTGVADVASQMLEKIAYSAIDTGDAASQPFGTQAISSLFKDGDTLGALFAPGAQTQLPDLVASESTLTALSEIAIQYAGEVAQTRQTDSKYGQGVIEKKDNFVRIDLSPAKFAINGVEGDTGGDVRIIGRDDLAKHALDENAAQVSMQSETSFIKTYVDVALDNMLKSLTLAEIATSRGEASLDGSDAAKDVKGNSGGALVIGSNGGGTFKGGDGGNLFIAGGGTNTITVGDGNNMLIGGTGKDTFKVGRGLNLIEGSAGTDTVDYSTIDSPADGDPANRMTFNVRVGDLTNALGSTDFYVEKSSNDPAYAKFAGNYDHINDVEKLVVGPHVTVKADKDANIKVIGAAPLDPSTPSDDRIDFSPSKSPIIYKEGSVGGTGLKFENFDTLIGTSGDDVFNIDLTPSAPTDGRGQTPFIFDGGAGKNTFNLTATSGGSSQPTLLLGGSGDDVFEFKGNTGGASTIIWGGGGNDTYDFDTPAAIREVFIDNPTEDDFLSLAKSDLQSGSITIINPTASDKLEYKGNAIGSFSLMSNGSSTSDASYSYFRTLNYSQIVSLKYYLSLDTDLLTKWKYGATYETFTDGFATFQGKSTGSIESDGTYYLTGESGDVNIGLLGAPRSGETYSNGMAGGVHTTYQDVRDITNYQNTIFTISGFQGGKLGLGVGSGIGGTGASEMDYYKVLTWKTATYIPAPIGGYAQVFGLTPSEKGLEKYDQLGNINQVSQTLVDAASFNDPSNTSQSFHDFFFGAPSGPGDGGKGPPIISIARSEFSLYNPMGAFDGSPSDEPLSAREVLGYVDPIYGPPPYDSFSVDTSSGSLVFNYSRKGVVRLQVAYGPDGNVSSASYFDATGVLLESETFEQQGDDLIGSTRDAGGTLSSITDYRPDGIEAVTSFDTHDGAASVVETFDTQGNLLGATEYAADGSLYATGAVNFDDEGAVTITYAAPADGQPHSDTYYQDGTAVFTYYPDQGSYVSVAYKFDSSRALVSQTLVYSDGSYEVKTSVAGEAYSFELQSFGTDGHLLGEARLAADGSVLQTGSRTYNLDGDVTETWSDPAGSIVEIDRSFPDGSRDRITFSSNAGATSSVEKIYDSSGALTTEISASADGSVTVRQFGDDEAPLSKDVANPDGTRVHIGYTAGLDYAALEVSYAADGSISGRYRLDADGSIKSTASVTTDADGTTTTTWVDAGGAQVDEDIQFADGGRSTLTKVSRQPFASIARTYDGSGRLLTETRLADNGSVYQSDIHTYSATGSSIVSRDAAGAVIAMETVNSDGAKDLAGFAVPGAAAATETTYDPFGTAQTCLSRAQSGDLLISAKHAAYKADVITYCGAANALSVGSGLGAGGGVEMLALADLAASDVELSREGDDLVLTVTGSGQRLVVDQEFGDDTGAGISRIAFTDGTVLSRTAIAQAAWYRAGAGDVTLQSSLGDTTLVAGTGNDTLIAQVSDHNTSTTFVYGSADGNLTIEAPQREYGAFNSLDLTDLDAFDISLARTGQDLVATVLSTGRTITVRDQFDPGNPGAIQTMRFRDGTSISEAQMLSSTSRYVAGPGDVQVVSPNGDATLVAGPGNDILVAGDDQNGGNQTTFVYASSDGDLLVKAHVASPGVVNNTLALSDLTPDDVAFVRSGGDLLATVAQTGHVIRISGEFESAYSDGVQQIAFGNGVVWSRDDIEKNLTTFGTPDADQITYNDSGRLDPGTGDDNVEFHDYQQVATVVFRLGDGHDVYTGRLDTSLKSGTLRLIGVDKADVIVGLDPADPRSVVVSVLDSGDSVTLRHERDAGYGAFDAIQFDDGTVWDRGTIVAKAAPAITGDPEAPADAYDTAGLAYATYDLGPGTYNVHASQDAPLTIEWAGTDGDHTFTVDGRGGKIVLLDLNLGDVTVTRGGDQDGSLFIVNNVTGKVLSIVNQYRDLADGYDYERYGIATVQFADGSSLERAQIMQLRLPPIVGDPSAPAGAYNRQEVAGLTYDLGAGDYDVVAFHDPNLEVDWANGDGNQTFLLQAASAPDARLRLSDLNPADVMLTRTGASLRDLTITNNATGAKLVIKGEFRSAFAYNPNDFGQGVQTLTFADGTTLTSDAIASAASFGPITGSPDASAGSLDTANVDNLIYDLGTGSYTINTYCDTNLQIRWGAAYGSQTFNVTGIYFDSSASVVLTDLSRDDVTLSRGQTDFTDLVVTNNETGAVLTVPKEFQIDNGVGSIRFADGSALTTAQISGTLPIVGTASAEDYAYNTYRAQHPVYDLGSGDYHVEAILDQALEIVWRTTSGNEVFDVASDAPGDAMVRLADLDQSDVSLAVGTQPQDLKITNRRTGAQLTLLGQFDGVEAVGRIVFADGTALDSAQIDAEAHSQTAPSLVEGTPASDEITVTTSSTIVHAAQGDDIISHDDRVRDVIYRYATGDGNDAIFSVSAQASTDVLKLTDLNAADVQLARFGDDLTVSVASQGQTVTVHDQFADMDERSGIGEIVFADGSSFDQAAIRAAAWQRGTPGDDHLHVPGSNMTVDGGPGNDAIDHYDGQSGETFVYAHGDGNDVISAFTAQGSSDVLRLTAFNLDAVTLTHAGDDLLVATPDNGQAVVVKNQFLDDTGRYGIAEIAFADGTHLDEAAIASGAWYRAGDAATVELTASRDGATMQAGAGDDTLYDAYDGGTFVYASVNGNLDVEAHTGAAHADTLDLTDLNAGDLTFTQHGSDLLIGVNATSRAITISGQFNAGDVDGVQQIAFADGSIWNHSQITAATQP